MIFDTYYLNVIYENTCITYLTQIPRFFKISNLYLFRAYIVMNYYFCINYASVVIDEHCGVCVEEY